MRKLESEKQEEMKTVRNTRGEIKSLKIKTLTSKKVLRKPSWNDNHSNTIFAKPM